MRIINFMRLAGDFFMESLPGYAAPFMWLGKKMKEKWNHAGYKLFG